MQCISIVQNSKNVNWKIKKYNEVLQSQKLLVQNHTFHMFISDITFHAGYIEINRIQLFHCNCIALSTLLAFDNEYS